MSSDLRAELRCYMNLMALDSLPESARGPRPGSFRERLEALSEVGFGGVQFATPATPEQLSDCRATGFGFVGSGRINSPEDALPLAERLAGDGYECATLHVGWGLEDDDRAGALIEAVLDASQRQRIPLYIETHRATILQDMWRSVRLVQRFPELRLNGDFSHWYTGQEMVYGGFEMKFQFIQPVFERVRFLHGRIGNPGCMQVRVEESTANETPYVGHFKQLWTACFRGFLNTAAPGDCIYFAPELLAPRIYYARAFPNPEGVLVEESDRWQQSLLLKRIAEACFDEALH
jgi:hypothetical protein